MARGRKKVAAEILESKGAYRKNPQRENKLAPKADGKEPVMPDYFNDDEKEKWREIVADLRANGILSQDCREVMIAYCTAYGGWINARRAVLKTGIVLVRKNDEGQTEVKRNPFSVELHKYRDEMNRLLPEFGLTPSSRSRLIPPKDDKQESAFSALLDRMSGTN